MKRAALLVAALVAVGMPARAQSTTTQLARVAGTVAYQTAADTQPRTLFGRIDLPDSATAITLDESRGRVRFADSSTIELGAKTRVRLGAFNAIESGNPNVIALDLGTLHFIIRHPAGGRANYRFQTSTSQIAVRGTEGYIVTGPTGTDFYCVDCAPGDVTVTAGARSYQLQTGEQAIIIGTKGFIAFVDIVKRPCANPAAIAISDGKLGAAIPVDQRYDTTGAPGGDPTQPNPDNS